MKTIQMSDLKIGDIFCNEIKLHGREAFLVTEIHEKSIHCQSRNSGNIIKKQKAGQIILLKNNYKTQYSH